MVRAFDTADDETTSSSDSDGVSRHTDDTKPNSHTTSTWKVLGKLADSGATGVLGHNTATTGEGTGVEGVTDSSQQNATGVSGRATASSGRNFGVAGYNNSTANGSAAVYGEVTAGSNTGATSGVFGVDPTEAGAGVYGLSSAASGTAYGLYGETVSADGYGVYSAGDSKTTGNHEASGYVQAEQGFRGNVGASAYRSTNQTVPADSEELIVFDQTEADQRGEFDTSAGTFTCASDGVYHVESAVNIATKSASTGQKFKLEIDVNGGTRVRNTVILSSEAASEDPSFTISKTLYGLNSGDTISLVVDNVTNSSFELYGGSDSAWTYLTVHQVG